jgi:hypothetical protein
MFALLLDAALVLARSKRGRRLAAAGAVGAWQLAQGPTARRAYARTWTVVSDPRPRRAAGKGARTAAWSVKRRIGR